jgi:hypothetical protein
LKNNSVINLVEALRGNREKISILFGLFAVGFLALSIYIFGTQAKFSWVTFLAYIIFTVFFLYIGYKINDKNPWFVRLNMLLNGIQILLSLAGWIWVLYLAQENPGGRYDKLVNLPFYYFLLFFLIIFLTTFASLMFSMVGLARKNKQNK